jgi:hypothetical protein
MQFPSVYNPIGYSVRKLVLAGDSVGRQPCDVHFMRGTL